MNKNSQVHSELEDKHQFGEEDKRHVYRIIYNMICENVSKKGAKILTDNFLKYVEAENAERWKQEKKRKKRKAVCIVVLACFFLLIIITCFVEWLGKVMNLNGILGKILLYAPLFAEGI